MRGDTDKPLELTLRDYFAAHAPESLKNGPDSGDLFATALACYEYADAMLKARGD